MMSGPTDDVSNSMIVCVTRDLAACIVLVCRTRSYVLLSVETAFVEFSLK